MKKRCFPVTKTGERPRRDCRPALLISGPVFSFLIRRSEIFVFCLSFLNSLLRPCKLYAGSNISHAERKASVTGQRSTGLSAFLLQHFQAHLPSQPCPEGQTAGHGSGIYIWSLWGLPCDHRGGFPYRVTRRRC